MKKQKESPTCGEAILQIIEKKKPETVKELLEIARRDYGFAEHTTLSCLTDLESKGRISLRNSPRTCPRNLKCFLLSLDRAWYWAIALTALASAVATFAIPENAFPWVLVRFLLGSFFVLFLPGYCFIRIFLFSQKPSYLEKVALSIGISIFFVFVVGLLLNYTPWGISLVPITLSLLFLTLFLATAELLKEYRAAEKNEL